MIVYLRNYEYWLFNPHPCFTYADRSIQHRSYWLKCTVIDSVHTTNRSLSEDGYDEDIEFVILKYRKR